MNKPSRAVDYYGYSSKEIAILEAGHKEVMCHKAFYNPHKPEISLKSSVRFKTRKLRLPKI